MKTLMLLIALLVTSACGRAQLDTITKLSCPPTQETVDQLAGVYGAADAQSVVNRLCP